MPHINEVSRDALSTICAFSCEPYTTNQVSRRFNRAWPGACHMLINDVYRSSPLFERMARFGESDAPHLVREVFQRYAKMRLPGEHPFDFVRFVRRSEMSTVALAKRFEEQSFTPTMFARMTDAQLSQAARGARALFQDMPEAEGMRALEICSDPHIYEIPEEVLFFRNLDTMDFSGCTNLVHIPPYIAKLERLAFVTLVDTSVRSLPQEIADMDALQALDLQNCTALRSLPQTASRLRQLARLNVNGCRHLQYIPEGLLQSPRLLLEGHGAPAVERTRGPVVFEASDYAGEVAAASSSGAGAPETAPPVPREAFTAPVVASADSRCCTIS